MYFIIGGNTDPPLKHHLRRAHTATHDVFLRLRFVVAYIVELSADLTITLPHCAGAAFCPSAEAEAEL